MAYAEKRGRHWRGRYKQPPGVVPLWGTIARDPDTGLPFTRKADALGAAEEREVELRLLAAEWNGPVVEGLSIEQWREALETQKRGGRDPNAGKITFEQWCRSWFTAQDLEETTELRYRYLIDHFLIPAFGNRSLDTIVDHEEIAAWEKQVRQTPKQQGTGNYAPRTAADARSLLATILGDAKAAGRIEANAAERRRGRGRKRTRRRARARSPEKAWPTPLQALLVAERTAIMSGRDDEFVLVVTIAWTGMRWGEAIGLEDEDVGYLDRIELDWQLREAGGRFTKVPPKDDSARRIDKPPFLADLLSRQVQARQTGRCGCPDLRCGGAGRYLFLSPGQSSSNKRPGHHSRSGFADRYWHPAADGAYPQEGGKRPRPARPVLVDGITGLPLRPPWPYAVPGQDWEPPRGRGVTRWDLRHDLALTTWLPIKQGLTPHGLRHGHEVWMQEDGIPEILRYERMGHIMTGIKSVYSHVSPVMRAKLRDALQRRWEDALAQRAAMDRAAGEAPHSPVALLDELLQAHERKLQAARGPRAVMA
ncbi:hypothetical protein [Actinomadura miaoliensis]|uniref:Core-binding (CB) domain-containing protein n=1 Tax=Actinomadura miaoliensis TaxID=430685 RepID=A0ABP7WB54_9ACTN